MLPKAEKVSYRALLSMDLSRFLIKTLPTPDFLREGSLWDHMILIGFPFTTSKFMVSRALSAAGGRAERSQERSLVVIYMSENISVTFMFHASVCYLLIPCNNNNAAIFNACTIMIKERNRLNALKQAANMFKGVKVLQQTIRLMRFLQAAGKSVGGSCSGLAWSTCLPVLINHMLLSHMPLSNAAGLHLNTIRISAHVVEMSSNIIPLFCDL